MTRRSRRRGVLAVALVLLAVTTVAVSNTHRRVESSTGIGSLAVVTASQVAPGSSLPAVVHGTLGQSTDAGWITTGAPVGAWITLSWSRPHLVRRILLQRGSLSSPGVLAGYLSFGDGSRIAVTLSRTSTTTVLPITPRSVSGLTFTVTSVSKNAHRVGLRRIQVFDGVSAGDVDSGGPKGGDVAPAAEVTSSPAAKGADLRALVDGSRQGRPGAVWHTDHPQGGSVTLSWPRPRELDMIAVAGAASRAALLRGTLRFPDGSSVVLGAVLPDPGHPTIVAFMPRVTRSVRLSFDRETGPGRLALAEISTYQIRAAPLTAEIAPNGPAPVPAPACAPSSGQPTDAEGLVVQCPSNATSVGNAAQLHIGLGPSYPSVRATVLPAVPDISGPPPVDATASAGVATVDLDTSALPAGPFTVELEAASASKPTKTAFLQLIKTGVPVSTDARSSSPAHGRTLVYDEDFNRPVTINRSGGGADYAAAKPKVSTAEDFGDAIFADPGAGLGNEQQIDNQYLQISAFPRPANYPDPAGYGRQYVGGMLSSARPGGSGFSAQYGYFEARMLAPAAPGTWPAFWMLPDPNLIAPESTVAEIDAVEMYGQFPNDSCQSTHQYAGGKDMGIAACGTRWPSTAQSRQWHTYGVSIDPTRIQFYIDNKLVASSPQVSGGSDPLFFMVDLALGGGYPDDLSAVGGRASLFVDYIRVYD